MSARLKSSYHHHQFRDKCTPTHSCVSAGSRRAGTGGKFVVGNSPGMGVARQCEACRLVYLGCEKGMRPIPIFNY